MVTSEKKMKGSTKLLLTGVFTIATVVGAGELFDAMGVLFGPTQAGLSCMAGVLGCLKLFSGT